MPDIGYSLSVDIKGLEEQIKKIGNFGPLLNAHLETAMKEATIFTASKIVPLVPVGVSSRLKNSIGSEIKTEGIGSIVGRVGSSLKDEQYPAVMEFGRKPGSMPPPEALVRWVHVKGIAGSYSGKPVKGTYQSKGRRKGSKAKQASEDLAAAWVIARAIKAHGIKGRGYMKAGLARAKPSIPKFFKREMDELMKEISLGS